GVFLEVFPEAIAQGVFGRDTGFRTLGERRLRGLRTVLGMKDGCKTGSVADFGEIHIEIKIEPCGGIEAHQENAFAVLRHYRPRVEDLPGHFVPELIPQHVEDDTHRAAPIMTHEVLDVLQKERAGPVNPEDLRYVKEESALSLIRKPVRPSQGILLGNAGDGERLTRKSGQQYV